MSEPPGPPRRQLSSAALASLVAAGGTLVALLVSGSLNARVLGPTDRGYYALIILVPSLFCQLGGLGISLSLAHYLARRDISVHDAAAALRGPIGWQLGAVSALTLAGGIVVNVTHPSTVLACACAAVLLVPTTFMKEYGAAVIQGCGRSALANVLRVFPPVLWAVTITVLFVARIDDLRIVVAATILSETISSVTTALVARRVGRAQPATPARAGLGRTELLRFGRAGYIAYLSPLDTFRLDQLYVGLALSPLQLGYYAVGAAFTTIPRVVAHTMGLTAAPFVSFAQGSAEHSHRRAGVVFVLLAAGVSAVSALAIGLGASFLIPAMFGDSFAPAIPITQVLMVGGFVLAVRRIVVDVLRGTGDASVGAGSEIGGLVVFFALAPILSHSGGATGVAWAFSIAAMVNVTSLVIAKRRHAHALGRAALGAARAGR